VNHSQRQESGEGGGELAVSRGKPAGEHDVDHAIGAGEESLIGDGQNPFLKTFPACWQRFGVESFSNGGSCPDLRARSVCAELSQALFITNAMKIVLVTNSVSRAGAVRGKGEEPFQSRPLHERRAVFLLRRENQRRRRRTAGRRDFVPIGIAKISCGGRPIR